MDFHLRIAEAPQHDLLLEQLAALQAQTRQAAFYAHLYDDPQDVVEDHRRLLVALRTGDPARAAAAMRAHIEASGQKLLSRMTTMERDRSLVGATR
jgi:DNA-binding FadR family transcriptional regulator